MTGLTALPMLLSGATLLAIAHSDARTHRIPNGMLLWLLLVAVGSLVVCGHSAAGYPLAWYQLALNTALLALLALPGYLRGQLGAGDAKLMLICALLLPTGLLLGALVFAWLCLGLAGALTRRSALPMAPYLVASGVLFAAGGQL